MTSADEILKEEFFGHRHVTVIEPPRGLLELKLREVWAYRDLIGLLVRRDFVAQYKQTILGPVWHLIQPLLTTLMFTLVFGRIARIPTDGAPPFLFYMTGTVLWTYFASLTSDVSHTFIRNAGIFGKVYFPRLAVPTATLFSKLISFGIQLSFLLAALGWYALRGRAVAPNSWVLATPLLLALTAAFGLGIGVIVSSLTTRYRDLAVLVGFGLQLYMYATPVIYPLSALSEKSRFYAALNPLAPVVETFRYAFLGTGGGPSWMLGYSAAVVAVVLLLGLVLFNRVERTFMDTV